MGSKKTRLFFNLLGLIIVTLWLVMIGALIKKVHFVKQIEGQRRLQSVKTIDSPQRDWKEIFLKDEKVGYAVNLIRPFEEGYLIQEEIFLKLNLMGLASGVHAETQCQTDDKLSLKSFDFHITSGAVGFNVSGRVEGNYLLIETRKGKGRRTEKIRLSSQPMIGAGMGHFFKNQRVRVGETFKLPIFDPYTMTQKEAVIHVVGKEAITINRMTYEAFRLEAEVWGRKMTFWLDEDGTTLKEEGFMGLTTVKSSAARAPQGLEGQGGMDFYEMAAVSADRKLPDSARLSYLKLRMDGIDNAILRPEVLNKGRQRFDDGIMEVNKERPPFRASYALPYDHHLDDLRVFIEPEFNIESDEKEIRNKAREISGDDKDPLSVARRLLNWVYDNLEKKPVVTVPSAVEALRTRVGDCNEHATLLTALLRASKIPAQICTGLVYTRGKFFYHAWTEAYMGEWLSMDPTLNQMPVDATHVKLTEGNLDKQVEIAGFMGKLKLRVIDYRYD